MRGMSDRGPLSRVVGGLGAAVVAAMAIGTLLAGAHAQGRPPIAIAGARIIDGSGNEPFVGTIVFSGGRISAVGRQVTVPADAQTIDGAGKTVLPGLIESELRGGLVDASAAGRRRLGLALAAGVTTAAVPQGTAVPAGPAAEGALPRLLAPMPLEGPGRAAALPPGVRERRNGTLAVSLAGDPRADTAHARALNARLALAAIVGDDGTLDVAAVTATGLTPLDAVTALTGGGAWALGLQSDRGLLAPSMRADLVLVSGDPSAALEALRAVDKVFLGGVEVDRATLLAPAPAPPTPAPSPASGPETAAAAPTPAPTPAPPPATAKALPPARARRGARTAKTPPAPAATEAAPAAARVAPEPDTPAPVSPTASPAPAAPIPAPSPSAAPAAAPSSSTAAPSTAAPATASAAPVTPASPTAAAVAAPVPAARLREALLDDFERGETVSAVGPAWVGSGSGEGSGATTLIMGRVVKGLRDHALLLSARMGSGREPFARAALKLDAGERPVDLSRFRGLRFDARGEGRYRLVFVTRGVTDGRYHESYFSGSPLWTPVSIPFASIGQNGGGDRVPWTGRDVIEVRFEMVRDAGRLGWLELDNVTLY